MTPSFRCPSLFSSFPGLIAAESTRHGGRSTGPFASLNLGLYTDDDPQAVSENRRSFFAALGYAPAAVAGAYQVHGDEVLRVERPGQYRGYDALITAQKGILLTVTVADCAPVLIYDAEKEAVAAVHAGWRGTTARITAKTIAAMQAAFGTNPGDCFAFIGTCIDECSFEVDNDVAEHFSTAHKRWDEKRGKFFVDLKKANRDQLLDAGLSPGRIERSPFDTVSHNRDYFSYRREKGKTGRLLGVIGMRDHRTQNP